jgi:4-hydroxybenzoate polyprenyltransferase
MNLVYTIRLKRIPILDVFIIAVGFVLRIFAGGVNADIFISHWIVLMTFLLALFLAFAKRRDDVVAWEKTGSVRRKGIDKYNTAFMNQALTIVATLTMVCYIMYTMSDEVIERIGSVYLYLTSVWVLVGLFRYMQKTIVYDDSGSPTKTLYHDHFIQFCILGWIMSFFAIIYL